MNSQQLIESLISATTAAKENVKRHELSAAGRRKEAERKRSEAQSLLAEADRLEEQARDDDQSAEQARDMIKSLNFNTVLARLENNDADLKSVDSYAESLAFPDGYGGALGRSLRSNRVVTSVKLDLRNFLSTNTLHVSSKNVHDVNLLEAALSKDMRPDDLLLFLKTSPSLQTFEVYDDNETLNMAIALKMSELLLAALAESKSLRKVNWFAHLPPKAFCNFQQNNSGLTSLAISPRRDMTECSQNDRRKIASAIAKCTALEQLTLKFPTQEEDMAIRILQKLHQVKTLQGLFLSACDGEYREEYFIAISRYLRSAADTLQTFMMRHFCLDDAIMERIMSGLTQDSSTNGDDDDNSVSSGRSTSRVRVPFTSLSNLIFWKCRWDDDAAERLSVFLQTRTTNANGERAYQSSLRKLHVGCVAELGRALSQQVAASLLMKTCVGCPNGQTLFPTIGPQLEVLCLDHVSSVFFAHLSDHADRMGSLQNLCLTGISKDASMAFAKCLPKLATLRALGLKDMSPGAADYILKGLSRNGSVVNVFLENGAAADCFDAGQWRKVNAYCLRNKTLPSLIQSSSSSSSSSSATPSDDGSSSSNTTDESNSSTVATRKRNANAMDHDSGCSSSSKTLSLSPALLQVTHQVPITQSSMVLRGLLSQSQRCRERTVAAIGSTTSIQHDGLAKRSRREANNA